MPAKSVYAAGWIVVLACVVGLYLGISRSLAASAALAEEGGTIVPAVTPVASAKPILVPVPAMDEAEVRRLAREEAQALLIKPVVHKAPAASDDDDDATPDPSPSQVPTVPLAPAKAAVAAPPG